MAGRRSSVCDNFTANVFKKDRCQHCFHSKQEHCKAGSHGEKETRDEQIVKEGYLTKAPDLSSAGLVPKKWKKRWFVLSANGHLCYFEDQKTKKALGTVYLSECTELRDGDSETRHSNTLALNTPGRIYYIQGEDKDEVDDWFKAMVPLIPASGSGSHPMMKRVHSRSVSQRSSSLSESRSRQPTLSREHTMTILSEVQLPVKKGWLKKQGSSNKAFKDRWFVMEGGKLSYYKDDKATTPQGIIDLFHCTGSSEMISKKAFEFEIKTVDRIYVCSAESDSVRNQWLQALDQTLQKIRGASWEGVAASCGETPLKHSVVDEESKQTTDTSGVVKMSIDGQPKPNTQAGSEELIRSTLTLSEEATKPVESEGQVINSPDCLSVDHQMTAVLEAGVVSLSHQLEQTRAQLQTVEQQLRDEQRTKQSSELKLVEYEAAAEERAAIFESQLERLRIERDNILASSDKREDMQELKDEQIHQLEAKLSEMQRNKMELEEEVEQLQLKMEEQQTELKEEIWIIQQDKQRMEEEMQLKVDEAMFKAHSAEVKLSQQQTEQAPKTNTEETTETYESQLEELRLSLETATKNSEQRAIEVKEFYESKASELMQKIVDERSQRKEICESLQLQLDLTTTQLTESNNNVECLEQELALKQSEIQTLDVSLRSKLAAAENGLKTVQVELTVAMEDKVAAESKVLQLEHEICEKDKYSSELEQRLELEQQRSAKEGELQQANLDTRLLALTATDGEMKRRHEDELKALTVTHTAEIDELNRQLQDKSLYCRQLEEQVEQVTSALDDMKVTEAKAQRLLAETELKLSQADRERTELLKSSTVLEDRRDVIDGLNTQIEDLTHKLEASNEDKVSLHEDNNNLRDSLSKLHVEVEVTRQTVSEETDKLKRELTATREHLEHEIANKNSLEAQVGEIKLLKSSQENEMAAELATVCESLSHQLSKVTDLEDENVKLKQKQLELEKNLQLSNEQSVIDIRTECQLELDTERSKWNEEMEKVREELERQTGIVIEVKKEQEMRSTNTEETLQILQKGLSERDKMMAECKLQAEADWKRLESEKNSLKEQLRRQECALKETQGELNQLKAERLSMEASVSHLQTQPSRTTEEIAKTQVQYDRLTEDKLDMSRQMKSVEEKADHLQQVLSLDSQRGILQTPLNKYSRQQSAKSSRPKSLTFIQKSSTDSLGIGHASVSATAPQLSHSGRVACQLLEVNEQQLKQSASDGNNGVSSHYKLASHATHQTRTVPPPKPPKPAGSYRKRGSSMSGVMKWLGIGGSS